MTANLADLWKYDLRRGKTDHPRNGACLFDAGMWLVYGRIGDDPPCSCPVTRRYGIGLNDRMPHNQRQRLRQFILRIVGNRDPAAEPARARLILLETARRVVPLAFDAHWPALAAEMRALADDASASAIRDLMKRSQIAATDRGRRVVIRAGYDAADAAANAAANAANAADAANAAACADDARAADAYGDAWDHAIWILDAALRIGRQSPEFDESEIRAAVEQFELARVE